MFEQLLPNKNKIAIVWRDVYYPQTLSSKALFSYKKFCKIFQHSSSHRIFGHMHEALNID
jgi:hypothetical protein